MGAIAPMAKKLWGQSPLVAPTGILLCHTIVHSQKVQYNYECVVIKLKMCIDFSLKMHQKRLGARLRPDPLVELTALPQTPNFCGNAPFTRHLM